jgi:excisionase family DNA binding protein
MSSPSSCACHYEEEVFGLRRPYARATRAHLNGIGGDKSKVTDTPTDIGGSSMGKGIEVGHSSIHLFQFFGDNDMSTCPGTDKALADRGTENRLLTVKEFSVRYRRSRSRTYELIPSGELPAVKDGRSTLIPVDGAEAWAQNLPPMSS